MAEWFGLPTALTVSLAIHAGELAERELRTLTRPLFALADDPIARSILDRQADEVCAMGLAALRTLGLIDTPTDVVLGGGVLGVADPYLLGRIEAGFAAGSKATPRVVTSPPVAGAAVHALGAVGPVRERLMAAFRVDAITVVEHLPERPVQL